MFQRHRWTWAGVIYGCVLFVLSLLVAGGAGGGHGSYLLLDIGSAPASIVLPIVGVFTAPIWWGLVGAIIDSRGPKLAMAIMAVHLGSVVAVLLWGRPMETVDEQWRHFSRVNAVIPGWLWSGIIFYAFGQVVLWIVTLRQLRRQ